MDYAFWTHRTKYPAKHVDKVIADDIGGAVTGRGHAGQKFPAIVVDTMGNVFHFESGAAAFCIYTVRGVSWKAGQRLLIDECIYKLEPAHHRVFHSLAPALEPKKYVPVDTRVDNSFTASWLAKNAKTLAELIEEDIGDAS